MNRWPPLLMTVLLACSCSTLPKNVEREPSFALEDSMGTLLGGEFAAIAATHPGESGFVPVLAGRNAYLLRAAMAGLAERTLDLQYYIWADDLSGWMMLREVMHAADRGVRVRLLLDDAGAGGKLFTRVDAHPGIEVRMFNPFGRRDVRAADWLLDGARLNHRMHNKVMIADNAVAITGGRNIGNHYFAIDEVSNFRDLDLLAVGPVVPELSSMFDLYWNSEWAYPLASIESNHYTANDATHFAEALDRRIRETGLPFPLDADARAMRARFESLRPQFAWGPAYAVFDSPARVEGRDGAVRDVAEVLFDTIEGVHEELLIETAYLIPGDAGVEILGSLAKRGVDITILTNSLATNDVLAAHAGYKDYRMPLLEAGVKLHELRPDALAPQQHHTLFASESESVLHTKALVYDRRAVFVGTFNLDSRSLIINTENGVLVHSPELAGRIADVMQEGLKLTNSYQLELHDGELRWSAEEDGRMTYFDTEPQTSWWERFMADFLSRLPIDGQL